MEERALKVGHSLKMLLPCGVLQIPYQEKRDRQCCSSGEAVLTQGGSSDVRHQLNAGVEITADDGPQLLLRGVEGIIMLTSHWSMPWVMDSRQQWTGVSPL
jgi:hypothetical protein